MDLVKFLRARLDEDARIARAATPDLSNLTGWVEVDYPETKADETHAVRHAPPRILYEIEAKAALVDEFAPEPAEPETDAQMHARFAHPAFEYRTTEGPRKQWDHVDTPPADEEGEPEPGWERNVEAGRNGWERWEYTEESYWRRPLPEGQQRKPYLPHVLLILARVYRDHPDFDPAWLED